MIGRFYADNFRCLTNFELELDQTNIFLGPNGSGKTAVFDALRKIQNLTVRGARIEDELPPRDLSCLRSGNQVQQFELEIHVDQDIYEYMLKMEHNIDRNRMWIDQEVLTHNKKPLFVFEKGIARLYRDDYGRESSYQFDLTRSGIGFLHAHSDNKKLTRFKTELTLALHKILRRSAGNALFHDMWRRLSTRRSNSPAVRLSDKSISITWSL